MICAGVCNGARSQAPSLSAYQADLECALFQRHHGAHDKDEVARAENILSMGSGFRKALSWRISQGKKLF
jgi:hypothetical protein